MAKLTYSLPPVIITSANLGLPIQAATSLVMQKGWVKIINETPYQVTASINADRVVLEPQEVNGLKLNNTTSILYVIAQVLLTQQNPPSSIIGFEVHPDEDMPEGVYPVALPRQMSQSNFIGAQQLYSIYENTFTTAAGTHTEPIGNLPNAGFSQYIKRVEFSSGTVGAAAARCDMQLQNTDVNIVSGFPSYEAQVSANAGIPFLFVEFPGPVKITTAQQAKWFVNAPTGTFCALTVYYFIAQ